MVEVIKGLWWYSSWVTFKVALAHHHKQQNLGADVGVIVLPKPQYFQLYTSYSFMSHTHDSLLLLLDRNFKQLLKSATLLILTVGVLWCIWNMTAMTLHYVFIWQRKRTDPLYPVWVVHFVFLMCAYRTVCAQKCHTHTVVYWQSTSHQCSCI